LGFLYHSIPLINHELESSQANKINLEIIDNGDILYVGGVGPANYTNIQNAIDNAKDGDKIFVYSGIYPAEIVVDKSLTIMGEDRDNTIVRGGQDGFFVYSDGVKITNFTIRECGEFWSHAGIYLLSNDNTLTNNKIIENGKLNALFLKDSDNNTISNNYIENNPYHAIRMEYSDYNTFTENYVNDNQGDGLFIVESSNNFFELNTISLSFWGGITIDEYSENNILFHNNLINNGQNANDNGRNIWNNSYPSGGNYWSDYIGQDQFKGPEQDIPGSDGIGDTPYDLPCENAVDFYPLMNPYTYPYPPIITGQTNGKIGIEYVYNFFVDDTDNDELYLRVDWGTGSTSKWYGTYPSGTDVKLNYTWNKKGTYLIKAQVKDINELESQWGSLEIIIPRYNYHINDLQNQILKNLILKIVDILDFLTINF
jgi:parallel beta-helix repeat protein